MPRAKAGRRTTRTAPYQTRSTRTSTTTQPEMTVVGPALTHMWDTLQQHMPASSWQHEQQRIYNYQQPVMQSPYHQTMPTPTMSIAGAPAVQPASSSRVMPVQSSASSFSGPWTKEMDDILLEYHPRLKWHEIAERFFHNEKSYNACRKRFSRLVVERKQPSSWDAERVERVVEAYNHPNMRQQIWSPLAEFLGESWQDVEKLCFEKGLRGMINKAQPGHSRRRSQAVSHVSRRSVSSTYSQHDAVEEEPGHDSGLGADLQEQSAHPQLVPHTQEYHPAYQATYYDPYHDYSAEQR